MKRFITSFVWFIASALLMSEVIALQPEGQIQGYVVYANTANSPLAGVTVYLLDGSGQPIDSAVSAWNGGFLFRVHPGSYQLQLQIDLPWVHGAGNSYDALMVLKHFVGLETLTGVHWLAGNVNGVNNLNATDALQIAQRFAGMINYFAIDSWVWLSQPITVLGATPVQVVVPALLAGDVNGSYIPPAFPRPFICGDTLTDARDGQKYPTLEVGHQCWMGKNLNIGQLTSSTSNGGSHSDMQDNGVIEKYCYQNILTNCQLYGGLYDWDEAMQYGTQEGSRGICPAGWHIPADAEWKQLEGNFDSYYWTGHSIWNNTGFRGTDAGGNMKEVGTTHWSSPNVGATDLFGFTALPTGSRQSNGSYFGWGDHAYFWSSTLSDIQNAWYRHLAFDQADILRDADLHTYGFSVRCVWDTAPPCWPYPDQADAGLDTFNVPGNTYTLSANTPNYGDGVWEIISGTGGSLVNPMDPGTMLQGDFYETYTLVWVISNSCGVSMDTVVIGFSCVPMPDQANAGSNQQAVPGNTTFLDANTPSAGTGTWSVIAGIGGSFVDINDPKTSFEGNFYQTYTLAWTINTVCGSTSDEVVIAFDCSPQPEQAFAGADVLDILGNSISLDANAPSAGDGLWAILSGSGGQFADDTDPLTNFQGQFYETYTLVWTITTVCGSTSDTVVIGFSCSPMPEQANAGADVLDIAGDSIALAGNTPSVGSGQWIILTGTGGSLADANNPATIFHGQFSSAYTLVWTLTTICGSTSDTVEISFYTPPPFACGVDILTDDRDGKTYPTVQVGNQCWMAKNLNVGTLVNSIATPFSHSDVGNNSIIEKYCYGNDIAYCDTFGGLYDWNEAMSYSTTPGTQGICPDGWRMPTDSDWKTLEGSIDSQYGPGDPIWDNEGWRGSDVGAKLREAGTQNWFIPNNGATNSSGFTALPAGYRYFDGTFLNKGYWAYYWSSNDANTTHAWYRSLVYFSQPIYRDDYQKTFGFSVRCLLDN